MKTYTIIGGVNGVGKSSLTGVLTAQRGDLGIVVDTDKITAEASGNRIQGGKNAVKRIDSCLDMGINFTQETTLSGQRTLKTIKKAIERGYYIRLYYIGVNTAEESIKRIKNRVEKGGHSISDEAVRRRYNKRFEDLLTVLPYCGEAHFFDNENGFTEKAEYKNGQLFIKGDDIPDWLTKFKQELQKAGS